MARVFTVARVVQWFGTLLCLLIVFAFVYSTRRAVSWTSSNYSQVGVFLGAIGYDWVPDDVSLEGWQYVPTPGWCEANYDGSPGLRWWVEAGRGRRYQWVGIPLWMPFVAFVVPTAVLWYRDRRSVPAALRWLAIRLTPKRPQKVTFWWVALFCALHFAVVLWAWPFARKSYVFFGGRPNDLVASIVETLGPVVLLTTPLWAVLWAWLWTRLRNWLFVRQPGHHCGTCGYDLTGNVSGRCPECGTPVKPGGAAT